MGELTLKPEHEVVQNLAFSGFIEGNKLKENFSNVALNEDLSYTSSCFKERSLRHFQQISSAGDWENNKSNKRSLFLSALVKNIHQNGTYKRLRETVLSLSDEIRFDFSPTVILGALGINVFEILVELEETFGADIDKDKLKAFYLKKLDLINDLINRRKSELAESLVQIIIYKINSATDKTQNPQYKELLEQYRPLWQEQLNFIGRFLVQTH